MTFSVILNDKTQYTISFALDEDTTHCNIKDKALDFIICAGHAVLGDNDDYNAVEGMKRALERAINDPPCLFDRSTRGMIWDSFWSALDPYVWTLDEWSETTYLDELINS